MSNNYEPCFYNVSDDWQARWSLIREFTSKWHGIQFRDQWEYTGCQFWAIKKENINETDPLINIYQRDISYSENKKEDGFNCITDNKEKITLTSCIFWLILYSSRFSKGGDCLLVINNDPRLIDLMEENFNNKAVFDNGLIYEKQTFQQKI